ncbi:MAG: hypothetical protein IJR88_01520 [Clostridia bacterium]|nr:hypothetical protein [Clostridia bacterium]
MAAFLKKNEKWLMGLLSVLALAGAVLFLFVAAPGADAAYRRTMDIIIGLLMLLLCGLCVAYLILTRDSDPNFFLFDRAKKKNIPVSRLSFTTVNERMNFLETVVCSSVEELWTKNILENAELGYRNVYRPLLAYKMIYDVADLDVESQWNLLYNVPSSVLSALCRALEEGGDAEFAKMLHGAVEKYQNCTDAAEREARAAKIREFVCKNMSYLRGRIMQYVKRNIEFFY